MILSRKMLKRVGESRHPCRTPTVVLNHSPVLPLNRTARWALSYRFSMARMMLALMLHFLIVAHKVSCLLCQRPSWSLWRHGRDSADAAGIFRRGSWDWIFVLWCSFRLWNLLALLQWSLLLVAGVCLGCFQHDLTRMADKAESFVVLAQLQVAFLWECDN